jgi:hypothetical protein
MLVMPYCNNICLHSMPHFVGSQVSYYQEPLKLKYILVLLSKPIKNLKYLKKKLIMNHDFLLLFFNFKIDDCFRNTNTTYWE